MTYFKICDRIIKTHLGKSEQSERGIKMREDTLLTDEELEKKKKRAAVIDKITTGLLILLMASPLAILLYIFLWFAQNMS